MLHYLQCIAAAEAGWSQGIVVAWHQWPTRSRRVSSRQGVVWQARARVATCRAASERLGRLRASHAPTRTPPRPLESATDRTPVALPGFTVQDFLFHLCELILIIAQHLIVALNIHLLAKVVHWKRACVVYLCINRFPSIYSHIIQ